MGYVFISYSSENQSSADAMRTLFKKYHIDNWMAPNDIPAGSNYAQVIRRAIKDCACMLLILTYEAQNSPWVPKEVERAINYKKPIIPVQFESIQLNEEFELYISSNQIVTVEKIHENSEEIQNLLSSVSALTDRTLDRSPKNGKKQPTADTPLPATKSATAKEKPKRKKISSAIETSMAAVPKAAFVTWGANEEMKNTARQLDEFLMRFRVEGNVTGVVRGPQVTRYELKLGKGVQLRKLLMLEDDIALMLGVSRIRIATVPTKPSVVGVEVPNRSTTTVMLREVIASPAFTKSQSKVTFAVGKDVEGSYIVADLAKLPHLLIAGTSGSGMVVFMNSLILSLLSKAMADEVKLLLVDTKMVELGVFDGIPHLMQPVIKDPGKALSLLRRAVYEMMDRFQMMSQAGVRDLERYNLLMEEKQGKKLPRIVVIINELADLMQYDDKEVEEAVCRIAQLGRAAGIHLILATQRPSSDVITGLIKANIPSRIAFSLASAVESRMILDTPGAEKLLGYGDMLFSPIGSHIPLRVQGGFVDSNEVRTVVDETKRNGILSYSQFVLDQIISADQASAAGETADDELLPMAVEVILESGSASSSILQRKLNLGYARAARIIDALEAKGIVGPFRGAKPRQVLITKEQWAAMK